MTKLRPPIQVLVERPDIPLLWLDTSILIEMRRLEKRKSNADVRVRDLLTLVDSKRQAGKILCVESAQRREVAGHPEAAALSNPLTRIKDVQKQGWWISVDTEMSQELRDRAKEAKSRILRELEDLRIENMAGARDGEARGPIDLAAIWRAARQ